MNRAVTALLLVLLIQSGIAAAIFWPQQKAVTKSAEHALAPFTTESIDEIYIGDKFDNEAVLLKSGGRWLVSSLKDLPADSTKVDALLQAIIDQPVNWPIGSSARARQRFQVANYHYQKRLSFFSRSKKLGTIFLGTSPGFRKVHARNANQVEIYGISFNAFDAPAVSGYWLDPGLLQLRSVLRIDADLYSVSLEDGAWLSGSGRSPDPQALDTLITALSTLHVEGVADQDTQRDLSVAEADMVLAIQNLAGHVTLELFTLQDQHFVQSSQYPMFFKLSTYDFDRLMGIDFRLMSGEEIAR